MGNINYAPLFMESFPSFCAFCGNNPSKRPRISARQTSFQKTSRTIVVLRRANGSPERKCSSSPERPILTQKTAKSAILAQFGLFKKIVRIDQFCAELHLFSRNLFVQPRTTIVRGIFWKNHGGLFAGLGGENGQNGQKLRNGFIKGGGGFWSLPNF